MKVSYTSVLSSNIRSEHLCLSVCLSVFDNWFSRCFVTCQMLKKNYMFLQTKIIWLEENLLFCRERERGREREREREREDV